MPSHPDRVPRELYQDYVYQPPKAVPCEVAIERDGAWALTDVRDITIERIYGDMVARGRFQDAADLVTRVYERDRDRTPQVIEPTHDAPWGV